MSGTIRSRTEARKAAHHRNERYRTSDGTIVGPCVCGQPWPCPDWVAADDTLTDLNNAEFIWEGPGARIPHRLLPDPGHPPHPYDTMIPNPDSRDWPMPKPPPYPADDENDA